MALPHKPGVASVSSQSGVTDPLSDESVDGILAAYRDEAYQQGYARATRDVLATYPRLIERFLQTNQLESPELRRALSHFGRFVRATVDRRLTDAGFVSEGLGI